jgi:hypothetical protein
MECRAHGVTIGRSLAGALVTWRWGARFPRRQRPLAVVLLGTTGLTSLILFLLNRYYACILTFDLEICLFDGLGILSLWP